MRNRLIRSGVAAASLFAATGASTAVAQGVGLGRAGMDTTLELASFDSVWRRIRDTYYDPGMHGLDWNRVRDDYRALVRRAQTREDARVAIGQMLALLRDSHFGIIPGDQVTSADEAASEDTPGDVGMELRFIGSDLVVSRVDPIGPASRAGVSAGWVVDDVDGTRIASLLDPVQAARDARERRRASARVLLGVMHRLQGAPGSGVRVRFLDPAGHRVERVIVRREPPGAVVRLGDLPPMPTWLERSRLGDRDSCTGVIRFNTWMTPVSQAFEDALDEMRSCDGIVLDLRGNVGGVAAMVVGIAGHFTDRELPLGVLHMRGSDLRYVANPRRVTRDGRPVSPYAGSLALLVDELSASTTEIFAAALQQQGRARVFGDTTAGQALPSLITRLPNGDGLLYAIADFTDPGGRRLEGSGIIPDERVPLTRPALLAGRDEALQAALRWIDGERHSRRAGGLP